MNRSSLNHAIISILTAASGLACLSHYGWQLPAGLFLLWWARNAEKKIGKST